MERLHARYPWSDAAREAVESADVELLNLLEDENAPVRRRARERLEEAITQGRVGDPVRDTQTELLSYPVARILVSLVDEPALTERYAEAEAERAYELFVTELRDDTEFRTGATAKLTLASLLEDLGLEEAVKESGSDYRVAVCPYLELTAELRSGQWRLVNRVLADGSLPVSQSELFQMLEEAVRQRVLEGLPASVPEPVATVLHPDAGMIEAQLADVRVPRDLDEVDPDGFPPCVLALLERLEAGRRLPAHSEFALVTFLAGIGATPDELQQYLEGVLEPEAVTAVFERVHGESRTAAYPPPSCVTMAAYGDCVNKDKLCERIEHPLEYYKHRLEAQ